MWKVGAKIRKKGPVVSRNWYRKRNEKVERKVRVGKRNEVKW